MHTTYGMGGVFSYLVYGSRGNLNSRYLEWGFLAMFSINLSFLCIPYVVVCIKKPCPPLTIGTDRAKAAFFIHLY